MTFEQRLAAIRARLEATPLDCVIAIHDGAHFIEKPDPVMVLTGFKALGPVAAVLDRAGAVSLVVTPSWDAERAREVCPGIKIIPADDVIAGLKTAIGLVRRPRIGRHRRAVVCPLRHRATSDRSRSAFRARRRHRVRTGAA